MGIVVLLIDTALPIVALIAALAFDRRGRTSATLGMLVGAGLMLAVAGLRLAALAALTAGTSASPAGEAPGATALHYVVAASYWPALVGEAVFLGALAIYARALARPALERA